jgi:hypothetical protein
MFPVVSPRAVSETRVTPITVSRIVLVAQVFAEFSLQSGLVHRLRQNREQASGPTRSML